MKSVCEHIQLIKNIPPLNIIVVFKSLFVADKSDIVVRLENCSFIRDDGVNRRGGGVALYLYNITDEVLHAVTN